MGTKTDHDGVRNREEPMGFDLWVKRTLKDRYGRVAKEPIPPELLELLAEPRQDGFVGD